MDSSQSASRTRGQEELSRSEAVLKWANSHHDVGGLWESCEPCGNSRRTIPDRAVFIVVCKNTRDREGGLRVARPRTSRRGDSLIKNRWLSQRAERQRLMTEEVAKVFGVPFQVIHSSQSNRSAEAEQKRSPGACVAGAGAFRDDISTCRRLPSGPFAIATVDWASVPPMFRSRSDSPRSR